MMTTIIVSINIIKMTVMMSVKLGHSVTSELRSRALTRKFEYDSKRCMGCSLRSGFQAETVFQEALDAFQVINHRFGRLDLIVLPGQQGVHFIQVRQVVLVETGQRFFNERGAGSKFGNHFAQFADQQFGFVIDSFGVKGKVRW